MLKDFTLDSSIKDTKISDFIQTLKISKFSLSLDLLKTLLSMFKNLKTLEIKINITDFEEVCLLLPLSLTSLNIFYSLEFQANTLIEKDIIPHLEYLRDNRPSIAYICADPGDCSKERRIKSKVWRNIIAKVY